MENFSVERKELLRLTKDTYVAVLGGEIDFKPGQFVMVDAGKLVRKPFMLGRWNAKAALSIKVVGDGTRRLVQSDSFRMHGPLGKPFKIPEGRGAVLVAPSGAATGMLFHEMGIRTVICTKEPLEIDVPFESVVGDKAFLKLLESLEGNADWVLVIGSKEMRKRAAEVLKDDILYVSLDEFMACGVGACKGCAVFAKGRVMHVCKNGPIFHAKIFGGELP